MATSANRLALKIVGDGAATATFAELSERSNRIANGLRALGVKRGERILLMLGNVVPLWEVMLAAMKLGAVVIPATTLLTPNDLKDRFERGRVRHLIANAADAPKFAGLDPTVTRIALGDAPAGWHGYDDLLRGDARFAPEGETRATDPMLLYFTSGTTSRPKLVEHSHQSYPVGHLITMYWIGLQPGDMHLNISSPGWAKHAYSCFFAPWNAGATVFIANQPRFNARGMLDAIAREQGHHDLRAADRVAHVRAGGHGVVADVAARGLFGRRTAEPGDHRACAEGLGHDRARGLRPDRDHAADRLLPRRDEWNRARWARKRPAIASACSTPTTRMWRKARCASISIPPPIGLMRGYQNDDGSFAPLGTAAYRTGDVAARSTDGYYTYIGRADDVFKASDYRISPFELESALIEHPAVAEAAVVPAPDRDPHGGAEGLYHADARAPRRIARRRFRSSSTCARRSRRSSACGGWSSPSLPKTISGKIRRVELRQQEEVRAKRDERVAGEFREEDFPELRGSR